MKFASASVVITPSAGQAVYVCPTAGGPSAEGTFVQAVVVDGRVMAVVDLDNPETLARTGLVVSRVLVDLSSLMLATLDETVEVQR